VNPFSTCDRDGADWRACGGKRKDCNDPKYNGACHCQTTTSGGNGYNADRQLCDTQTPTFASQRVPADPDVAAKFCDAPSASHSKHPRKRRPLPSSGLGPTTGPITSPGLVSSRKHGGENISSERDRFVRVGPIPGLG
jgi:hypothetical protein